jgi:hypothetical protein
MSDASIEPIGQAIAGALIATGLFRTLVEKGVLTADEASGIINRAIAAVRQSASTEEQSALDILKGLQRQLHA